VLQVRLPWAEPESRFTLLYERMAIDVMRMTQENVPRKYWVPFYTLRNSDLKTAKAWAIKESLRRLWRYKRASTARSYWQSWYFWATHCRLDPVIKVAKMLKRRLALVLNYFTHRVTNALSEGINSRVEAIKNSARGFRNPERFKTMNSGIKR